MIPTFRPATARDVPEIVAMLTDDHLGAGREGADLSAYLDAFARIEASNGTLLIVGEMGDRVIATYQLSILPGLAMQGRIRATVESVRVASDLRSQGLGALLMADAEARAKAAGAGVLQLTTHNSRTRAHAFYERLGFTQSHKGYKREL